MINTLFGQFNSDIILSIPINIITSIIILYLFSLIFYSNNISTPLFILLKTVQTQILKLTFVKNLNSPWILILNAILISILLINLLGLFPYTFTITSHMSYTYSLAIPLWLAANIMGFILHFKSRLSNLVPQGTPWYLIPLMIWIETISFLAQPVALGLRLAANLTAGHLLLYLISTATWMLQSSFLASIFLTLLLILLFILEIGVACIQAYVFTALIYFYLESNN
uniref:ATP synthase subunit a n=1 Tax=Ocnus glacialis TaxID=3074281 RepID=A0AA51YFJ4_9ECHN|nr:ATP synthase F0 subunit 6 [Ocnus glacialis]WMW14033.1 ATP synthase F0 subunit 6 [Ocnus glacialis]